MTTEMHKQGKTEAITKQSYSNAIRVTDDAKLVISFSNRTF